LERKAEKSVYAKTGSLRRRRQKAGQTMPQPKERTETSVAKSVEKTAPARHVKTWVGV